MKLGLQPGAGYVGVFRMVLNLYVAKAVLSGVSLGGSRPAGRTRGHAGCCIFECTSSAGGTGEEIQMQQF